MAGGESTPAARGVQQMPSGLTEPPDPLYCFALSEAMRMVTVPGDRGSWASKAGFVLAAAGSAVGLGNVWRFPYITGKNGGGLFVLVYLVCAAVVGLPIMIAEILIGRSTQRSPIAAFRQLTERRYSPWTSAGWLGVAAGFAILSFYSVVAGWALYYTFISVSSGFSHLSSEAISNTFDALSRDGWLNIELHGLFMVLVVLVVVGGVRAGIERWSRILMPALFVMLAGLVVYGLTLPGRAEALQFMFGLRREQFNAESLLEALGQAFFSLSLGMGALTTYGSYLPKQTSIAGSAVWVAGLDTVVALLSSMVIFPVTFSHQIAPNDGPGLAFKSLPLAFSQMAGGRVVAIAFFGLLVFAALTSAISLLEVLVATLIDVRGWTRRGATLVTGLAAFVLGIPSALHEGPLFGAALKRVIGYDFLDLMNALTANWMLPLGGLVIAAFVGWRMNAATRRDEFQRLTPPQLHAPWLWMIRLASPLAVLLIMIKKTGLMSLLGVEL